MYITTRSYPKRSITFDRVNDDTMKYGRSTTTKTTHGIAFDTPPIASAAVLTGPTGPVLAGVTSVPPRPTPTTERDSP
ncbi:hypothetical protein EA472_15195 [Natrarchaeobius oligotrophus]|uniref:Uncharacterized protein n=1 Tax=Natrarchaeobius chitinivorans TaxID=1679083 RepID=A0A3N6MNX3_NATCH|nr:hypothetical protein EA472_15195 [Natrarchaeobius chitinivorans]